MDGYLSEDRDNIEVSIVLDISASMVKIINH